MQPNSKSDNSDTSSSEHRVIDTTTSSVIKTGVKTIAAHEHKILNKRVVLIVAALFLLFLGVSSFGHKARAGTETVPSTIKSDCSVNVTADLLSWIAAVPDGSTLEFGHNACYRIDGRLHFDSRNNLVFEGNDATFKAVTDGRELPPTEARTRTHWSFAKSSNITLKNMTIQGPNPYAGTGDKAYVAALEAQHGISFSGVQGGLIDNVKIYDVYGDFVYFGDTYLTNIPSRNVTVRNSHFERNGRQGISFTGAEDILLENNYIGQVRRTMFDIEPNDTKGNVRRITINKNTLGPKRLGFLSGQGAGSIVEDITVSDNTLTGAPLGAGIATPPTGPRRARIKIINNTTDTGAGNDGGSAFYFTRVDDIEVSGNTMKVQANRNMSAVQLYGSTNARIFNNTFLNVVTTLRADADSYGNQSSDYLACSNKITATGDFTDPTVCVPTTVNIDNPANGAILKDTVKIVASVTDPLRISNVEFYIDGILQEADSSAPYEYDWDTNTVPNNTPHNITVKATNAAGVDGSKAINVTVNNSIAESWSGVDGSAWPAKWAFEGATSGVKSTDIQNNQGRVVDKPGATGRVIAYIKDAAAANLNQTVQFRLSSNDAGAGLLARRLDSQADTYYIAVAAAGAPNNLRIKKVVGGVESNIAYVSRPMQGNIDYKIRFEVGPDADPSKTNLKVKVWEANNIEPPAYNIIKADAEPKLQGISGRFGLVYGLGNSRQVWTDDYSAVILP